MLITTDDNEQYLNQWRLIGTIVKPPGYFRKLGIDPPSWRVKIADEGNPDNRIVLLWENEDHWPAVETLQVGNRLYVEGALHFTRYIKKDTGDRGSDLINAVRRWQVEPPEHNFNEVTIIGKLKGPPHFDTTSTGRHLANLRITLPDDRDGVNTITVGATLYDDLADEAMLTMADGDMIYVVGIAKKQVWEERGFHKVVIHAFKAGLGIENEERIHQAYDTETFPAGAIL